MDTKVESQPQPGAAAALHRQLFGTDPPAVRRLTITCSEAHEGAPAAGVVEMMPDELKELSWSDEAHSMDAFLNRKDGSTYRPRFVLTKNDRAYLVTFKTKLVCSKESEIELDGGVFALDWTPLTPDMKRLEERVLRQAELRAEKNLGRAKEGVLCFLVALFLLVSAFVLTSHHAHHRHISEKVAPLEPFVERVYAHVSTTRSDVEMRHISLERRCSLEFEQIRARLDDLNSALESEKTLRRAVEQTLREGEKKLVFDHVSLCFAFGVLTACVIYLIVKTDGVAKAESGGKKNKKKSK